MFRYNFVNLFVRLSSTVVIVLKRLLRNEKSVMNSRHGTKKNFHLYK